MTFTPVLPLSGYGGWKFLNRTMAAQQQAFAASGTVQRDEAYFRSKIGEITSAEELVGDHRLLKVALGAYGLDSDINNRYFLRKVLEGSSLDSSALANRLADKSYLELNKAFGFGDFATPNTQLSDFADTILARYEDRQFEIAVGETNGDMRLALTAERLLPDLAAKSASPDALWFHVMGSEPLRTVFETAFGLPASFSAIDLDQQLGVFRDKAEQFFGDSEIAQFGDPEKLDELVRLFMVRSGVQAGISQSSPGAGALMLLQSGTAADAAASILGLLG